jgi:hypothetical protein
MGIAVFFEKVIGGIVMAAMLAGLAWFGGPAVWRHLAEGEAARASVKAQQAAILSDAAAASRAQASCAAEIEASRKAGVAIARIARPVKATEGEQPMITAKDLADAIR